jgi:nucleotide-binding universal stress UspA family protein
MSTNIVARRILVPLDGSELATVAMPWLRAIASTDTDVVLVRAENWILPMVDITGADGYYDADLQESALSSAKDYLETIANALEGRVASVKTVARNGMAADEILRVAEEEQVDLIIMATHGYGAIGRLLLGSVADRIARAAEVPVLLIHPDPDSVPPVIGDRALIQRIVVPLDGSERANAALPVASALARRQCVPMRLIRAIPAREELFSSREAVAAGVIAERMVFAVPQSSMTDEQRQYYEEYLTAATDALQREADRLHAEQVETSSEVLVGPTVPMLVSALTVGDLVVMSSHGKGGVRRWQLGSVAEQLIHRAVAPIVLVPDLERRLLHR